VKSIACMLFFLPTFGLAQSGLYARCGEPVGTRYDQVTGKVKQQADGFTGVNPTFIITKEAPGTLTFLWGPAAWARESLQLRERLRDAVIVDVTPEKITAVRIEPGGVTQMYSLYPTKGIVFFTQHRFIFDDIPSASTFYAVCEFIR
jgi:hypothetical protein